MKMSPFFWLLGFPLFLTAVPGIAEAGTIYGTEFGGSGFYEIDKSNGSHSTIGNPRTHWTNGLAYNPYNGTMYTIGQGNLYSLDTNTGFTNLIGGNGVNTTGLSFSSDFSTLYSLNQFGLNVIDTTTGYSSLVRSWSNSNAEAIAIATRSDGTLFVSGISSKLFSIDPTTYDVSYLGNISGLSHGVTSMVFDEYDTLYGISTVPDSLITIDTEDLSIATIGGDIGVDVRGLAYLSSTPTIPVPEPGTLALLGAGLLGLAVRTRRRLQV